jgi:hypothetical protein
MLNGRMFGRCAAAAALIAILAAGSFGQGPANAVDRECQDHLKALAFALVGYLGEHDGKLPAKISDLYSEGYVLDPAIFTCPASGRKITKPSEIEALCDYKLVGILTDKRPHLLVQDLFGGHGGAGFAYFSNQTFERIPLPAPAAGSGASPNKPSVEKPDSQKPAIDKPAVSKTIPDKPGADKPAVTGSLTGTGGGITVVAPKPGTPVRPPQGQPEQPFVAITNLELNTSMPGRPDLGYFVQFTGTMTIPPSDPGHSDQVVVYIYFDAGGGAKGAPVRSLDGQYADINGFAACGTAVYPIPVEGLSTTWQCWISYTALNVPQGKWVQAQTGPVYQPADTRCVADAVLYVDTAPILRTPLRAFVIRK